MRHCPHGRMLLLGNKFALGASDRAGSGHLFPVVPEREPHRFRWRIIQHYRRGRARSRRKFVTAMAGREKGV